MVEFNGSYFAVSEIVKVMSCDTSDKTYPKGLTLVFKNGETFGVMYKDLTSRDKAKVDLIRRIEMESRHYEEKIINRLRAMELHLKSIENRQLRLYKILKNKLPLEQLTE